MDRSDEHHSAPDSYIRLNPSLAVIQEQRLHVLKATMRAVQHIVNNSLNGLQLVRLEAEGVLPSESLELLDALIRDMEAKIAALAGLEETPEKFVAGAWVIDYESSRRGQ